MRNLLVIKEWYREMYSRYGVFIEAGMKFFAALLAVLLINANIGAMALLKNPLAAVAAAAVCALVPKSLMVLILTVFIVAHISAISLEMAGFVLVVLVIMFLLYFRFSSGDSLVLILMPVLFLIKIPFVMPVAMGLLGTPFSIVSVSFGTVLYFIMNYVHIHYEDLVSASSADGMGIMSEMARDVFSDQAMYLIIITFAVTLTAVYIIRRLSVQYSWLIASGAGTVINLAVMIIGTVSFGTGEVLSVPAVIIGNIVSLLFSVCLSFMMHHVDYARTERVQFEDDDYYYYVKAVPKITVPKKARRTNSLKNQKRH